MDCFSIMILVQMKIAFETAAVCAACLESKFRAAI